MSFESACSALGFEMHDETVPLVGIVERMWRINGERRTTLRQRELDDELHLSVSVPLQVPLRCGLNATSIRTDGDDNLPGDQITGHPLVGWSVRAYDADRATKLLERIGERLADAQAHDQAVTLTDDMLTLRSEGLPTAEEALLRRIDAAEQLAERIEKSVRKMAPPKWLRRIEKRWPSVAEAHHLELDLQTLTMKGDVARGTGYRSEQRRTVSVRVVEMTHAAPHVTVSAQLARPVARSAAFSPIAIEQAAWLTQLLGRRAFPIPGQDRFTATAQTQADAAALCIPEVAATLERLPMQVARGNIERERLEVSTAGVVTSPDTIGDIIDGTLELADALETHAPEMTASEPVPPVLFRQATQHGQTRAQRVTFFGIIAVAAALVLGVGIMALTEPEVGDHCVHDHECARNAFCLRISAHKTPALPPGASAIDRGVHDIVESVNNPLAPGKDGHREMPSNDGYCSATCETDSDCPSSMRCGVVRQFAPSPFGADWVEGAGTELRACIR